ncbi:diguanylate cyclase/phosphodiesterase (GGDEF & EAL domains) with PAS/PAC sensor(s) [hydrothermal vent metagenome]|uniref:Diguanylate cyclase/phosphodiesterase (GGDEF & EAL domains) with PAS/PAC sensor(S) n=1 Tax=hydrothermal vent metagenome TaxID=652676 RepID=A0A3B0ZLE3_9ZZZZ
MTIVQSEKSRRAHTRYTLKLPATITSTLIPRQEVEIYDFCIGGMYLVVNQESLAPTPVGRSEVISIDFTLPDNPTNSHHFQARVIRSARHNLGVSFLNPNKTTLQSVLNYATNQQQAITPVSSNTITRNNIDNGYAEIITLVIKNIRRVVDTYLLKQEAALLKLAKQSKNMIQQNGYFSTVDRFNDLAFKKSLLARLEKSLLEKPAQPPTQTPSVERLEVTKDLSLVEDDELNDWIAHADIANKTESYHHEELVGIEQRLTQLFGYAISHSNNPLGPESISSAYQEALKSLNLDSDIYLVCCRIFRDTLASGMGEIYQQVNQQLIKIGLQAEISYEIKKPTETNRRKKSSDTNVATSTKRESEQQVSESKELYDLISTLQSRHQTPHAAQTNRPHYSSQELIEKLANLSSSQGTNSQTATNEKVQNSVTLQLLQEIENRHEGKTLSADEMRIMETTGNLYNEMYQDNLITHGAKQWLGKLELPMLDEALQDDSILHNPNHLTRRFINKLAQLEHYNNHELDNLKGTLRKKIETMLQQLSQQRKMEPSLLQPLLEKVESLLEVQDKAYQHNLNEVIDTCNDHTTLPALKLNNLSRQKKEIDKDQFKEWRKRIRRMKKGDWILFDADESNAKRLRLVWISEAFTDYVFVNLKGQMQGSIKVDTLALHLSCGAAMVLNNADDSAFDRAQYRMLQKLNKQLLHETTHDALTGLLNRREFEKNLKNLQASQQEPQDILCYYDLDYFDVINNSFGFEAGDKLLIDVANIFKETLDDRGLLARVGGNEFALLLRNTTTDDALTITEQFKTTIKHYQFVHEEGKSAVSFSSGIVPINLQQHEATRLLQTAEAACRLAKGKGVSQLHIIQVDDSDLKKSNQVIYWASKIDDKLNSNALMLRYQPIVPVADKTLRPHAEILLGITDQTGSLVSPEHFILAAERYRRMPEIDRWVISNVFKFFKQHPSLLEKLGGIAINLSGLSINDNNIIPFIMDQLKASQLPTSRICFEITETAGIDNLSSAAEFIKEIKQSGVSFSLDDFGTGMSSYAYLKNLPVDYIKIDGSFIRDIARNKSDHAMVKSVTEIGHFMGKKIIAECVEDKTCLEILQQIGVDYGQGYAIQRPQLIDSLHTKI